VSLQPGFLKPANTNIFDSRLTKLSNHAGVRRLCCHHSASLLQFLSNTRNLFYCHKHTKTRRFGISLLPSSGGDTVRVKMGGKNYCKCCWFYSCTMIVKSLSVTSTTRFPSSWRLRNG